MPVVGLHVSVMVLTLVALALAVRDIQSNPAFDEQARSLWIVAMAFALPLAAIAYLVVNARRATRSLGTRTLWRRCRTRPPSSRERCDAGKLVAVFGRLRHGASEAQEDRILEVLDAITGHCHPDWRIFP